MRIEILLLVLAFACLAAPSHGLYYSTDPFTAHTAPYHMALLQCGDDSEKVPLESVWRVSFFTHEKRCPEAGEPVKIAGVGEMRHVGTTKWWRIEFPDVMGVSKDSETRILSAWNSEDKQLDEPSSRPMTCSKSVDVSLTATNPVWRCWFEGVSRQDTVQKDWLMYSDVERDVVCGDSSDLRTCAFHLSVVSGGGTRLMLVALSWTFLVVFFALGLVVVAINRRFLNANARVFQMMFYTFVVLLVLFLSLFVTVSRVDDVVALGSFLFSLTLYAAFAIVSFSNAQEGERKKKKDRKNKKNYAPKSRSYASRSEKPYSPVHDFEDGALGSKQPPCLSS